MSRTTMSRMRAEVLEIPQAVERLLHDGGPAIRSTAQKARARDPVLVATVARGSSDQAATYLKYAFEIGLGLPVASIGPSVASIYGARLRMDHALCIAISQSGASPDIVEMVRAAGEGGALTVAVTNHADSALAATSDCTLDIRAGAELSVAATKTFVTSVVAVLCVLAELKDDAALRRALQSLPEALARAVALDWPELRDGLDDADSLFTLGRGPSFAVSGEAALKFKEVTRIHAENYSSAEVLHGPVSIVDDGFPVLAFAARDAAEATVARICDDMADKGAQVFLTSDLASRACRLDHVRTDHPLTDPLTLIASFYAMIERLATDRGIDPDTPRHLRKVTRTL